MFRRSILILTVTLLGLNPLLVFAQNIPIDYANIISDDEMISYTKMNAQDIQRFLEAKQSYLGNYFFLVDSGERISAAEHIFRASQTHRINAQFILALLQKEQSLIEDQVPKQSQLDWAAGYGCLDNQPCNERWRGFYKQVNSAAEQFRYYFDHIYDYSFQPGKASSVDGQLIVPYNRVTAALYNYTPHLHGNELFKTIWTKYFVNQLPDGLLAQIKGDKTVWLIQNGIKRAFKNNLALVSRYDPKMVAQIAKADLDIIPEGMSIDFPAYSLLRGAPSKSIYLLTVDQKRLISSKEAFRALGFNPEEVDDVKDEQLALIPDGAALTNADVYPVGAVLQDKKMKSLFYIEAGRKYPILFKDLLKVNYPKLSTIAVTTASLDKYATGMPVLFRDGTLLKGSGPEVYVISNQKKRPIATEKAFETIGYKWKNIIVVKDEVLAIHPVGDVVDIK